MENIIEFKRIFEKKYDKEFENYKESKNEEENDTNPYRIYGLPSDEINSCVYKIQNKILALPNENKELYARMLLNAMDELSFERQFMYDIETLPIVKYYHEMGIESYSIGEEPDMDRIDKLGCKWDMSETILYTYKEDGVSYLDITELKENYNYFYNRISVTFSYCGIDLKNIAETISSISFDLDILDAKIIIQLNNDKEKIYKNTNFTAPRQVLAIMSILNELGIDTSNTDR